jgi:hypothetical protein
MREGCAVFTDIVGICKKANLPVGHLPFTRSNRL